MNWILNTDTLRLAAKAALKIINPNNYRSYATVARIVLTDSEMQLVATDAFRLLIYRLGASQRGTSSIAANLSHATLKKLAALPAKSLATVELTEHELRIIDGNAVVAIPHANHINYPNYESVVTDAIATNAKIPVINPAYLDLRDIFPKQKKQTGVQFIARHDDLYEFTDGMIRYLIVGIREAA